MNGTFREFLTPPPPPTASLTVNIPQQRGTFVTICNHMSSSPNVMDYIRVYSRRTSCELGQILMMCIHHCSIIRSIFTALKSPLLCPFIPSSSQPLVTPDLFTVPIVLPFPVCHMVRIIQDVAQGTF